MDWSLVNYRSASLDCFNNQFVYLTLITNLLANSIPVTDAPHHVLKLYHHAYVILQVEKDVCHCKTKVQYSVAPHTPGLAPLHLPVCRLCFSTIYFKRYFVIIYLGAGGEFCRKHLLEDYLFFFNKVNTVT